MENISAYIIENTEPLNLNISFLNVSGSKEFPFMLVVKSATEECIRLTIYPIEKEKIIKMLFTGIEVTENFIEILSKILEEIKIIHTSGLLKKGESFNYECYLNLNKSDIKYKDLIASIAKIRYIFKEIIIDEIGLKKA